MKKIIFTLALFFTLATSFAQEWAPVGTKWTYSKGFWGGSLVFDKPLIIESIGDTLINGQPCRIIYGSCECSFFGDTNFMYFNYNKIFLFNIPTNSFHPLYDFSAGKGEAWNVYTPDQVDSFKVVVDSVYSREIFGISYKIQKVRNLNYNDRWFFGGEVAEGIGNISQCFFPSWATCDP